MNEEELLREARIRSVAEPEELTFGELAGELELGAEQERRFCRRWRWWPTAMRC